MTNQLFDQPQFIAGQARVEGRVTIWTRCPRCQQEHGLILTARDHLDLSGPRYFRIECHGTSYFLRLSSAAIAAAVAQAAALSAEHDLSLRWFSEETYDVRWCTATAVDAICSAGRG